MSTSPELATDSRHTVSEQLKPNLPSFIDISGNLTDGPEVWQDLGFRAPVCATIEAGNKSLVLVDVTGFGKDQSGKRLINGRRQINVDADFLLVSFEDINDDGSRGVLGIKYGNSLMFGRANPEVVKSFDDLGHISGEHLSIEILPPRDMLVEDLGSLNGTWVTHGSANPKPSRRIHDNRTIEGNARLLRNGKLGESDDTAPYGYFEGDPIIGRSSPRISGGVYLGGGAREAITVKPEEDPRIERVYDDLEKRLVGRRVVDKMVGKVPHDDLTIIKAVYNTVRRTLAYDGPAVEGFSEAYSGDQKVSLGEYIERGIGVCRHQGLLAAYLLERLTDTGQLIGEASVRRNTIEDYGGTHAWAEYKLPDGTEIVIDAAQGFYGTKEEAAERTRGWEYVNEVT